MSKQPKNVKFKLLCDITLFFIRTNKLILSSADLHRKSAQ